jgi:hypothetical protein
MQELKNEIKETKEDLVDAIARWIRNHHNNCEMLHKFKWYRVSIEINGWFCCFANGLFLRLFVTKQ